MSYFSQGTTTTSYVKGKLLQNEACEPSKGGFLNKHHLEELA